MKKEHGFSLIELAIGITILGFLVGSVVAGKALIKNGQLVTIIKELTSFSTAANTFRVKYGAWPGDISNASEYWPGASNGNNDWRIEGGSNDTYKESVWFWNHLSRAEMIKGYYDGLPGYPEPGVKMPGTAYNSNGGYVIWWQDAYGGFGAPYSLGNFLGLGSNLDSSSTHNGSDFMVPRDAYFVDKKMDDGLPVSGRFIAAPGNSSPSSDCRTADYPNGVYKMDISRYACRIFYQLKEE